MKKIIIALLCLSLITPLFAGDKESWSNMTEEQQAIFLIGFLYGTLAESQQNSQEDTYNIQALTSDEIILLIQLINISLFITPDEQLRNIIIAGIQVITTIRTTTQ